jgi:hypothetical protein
MSDRETSLLQSLCQFSHAAAHPLLLPHRVARHLVGEHLLQHRRYGGVLLLDPRPPSRGLTLVLDGIALEESRQLTAAACDRWPAKARYLRDADDAPSAEAVGLDGGEQAALLLAQGGKECLQLLAVLLMLLVGVSSLRALVLMMSLT